MEDFREVKKRDFIHVSLWNLHSPLSVIRWVLFSVPLCTYKGGEEGEGIAHLRCCS